MLVPINITGGTYKHKSLPLSAQVTRNFWPQKQQDGSTQSPYVLESFPGYSLFGTQTGGTDRGMLVHKDILYKVTGQALYSVDTGGTHTLLGAVSGSQRCIMAGIGDGIVIVSEGNAYSWNGTVFAVITDTDLETPNSVAHLNNQIIYDGDGGRFCSSDVGDATSINGLNYATAESDADDLLRVYTFQGELYLMGTATIEIWFNSGSGNPPFDRKGDSVLPIGLAALNSVANNDRYIYLLGDDNIVYAVQGTNYQGVSTQPLNREFASYSTVSDAIGWCMNYQGQQFYVLCFPTANKTWVFPEGGEWFEWSSGSQGYRNVGNSYAYFNRKHLIADFSNGNIYELDDAKYTENGAPIIRVRDTGPLHGALINKPGKTLTMNRFELILEAGMTIDYQQIFETTLKVGEGNGSPAIITDMTDAVEIGDWVAITQNNGEIHRTRVTYTTNLGFGNMEVGLADITTAFSSLGNEVNYFESDAPQPVGVHRTPTVMLSYSDDGGKTFCPEIFGQITSDDFRFKCEWTNLASFESRIMRVKVSDPVHWCIYSAAADIEVGI